MSRLSRAFSKFSTASKVGTEADVAKWEDEYVEALRLRLIEAQAKAKAATPEEVRP